MQVQKITIFQLFAYPLMAIFALTWQPSFADSVDISSSTVPILPNQEQLSVELKLSPKELPKAVDDFANAITQGHKSKSYNKLCARGEEFCELLSDYFEQNSAAKEVRKARKRRTKPFHIAEKNIEQTQRFDFSVLVHGLRTDTEAKFIHLAEASLKTPDCPRNLSAALSVEAEEYYPSATARAYSKQLFQHAAQCLSKGDPSFERMFLRQGLYSYYEGDKNSAEEFLRKAKDADITVEKYRSLYWLGQIAFENEVKHSRNEAWQQLINEFPLSFYSIQASVKMGIDPISNITNHRVGGYKRNIEDDEEFNRKLRWLEALFVFKKFNAVGKWAGWIVREDDSVEVDVLNYISTLKIASGLYRSNINMLFAYFKKNPATLNQEALRLLYPRPFFQIVQEASKGKIDSFLVLALMRQESAFDAKALSHANAKGLMQIIPGTARRLASGGHRKLYNEKANTEMGVKYLVSLGQRFDGHMELVMAAYNAGPLKVDAWLKRYPDRAKDPLLWNDLIPYMETRDYVVSILRNNYFYTKLYGTADAKNSNEKVLSSEVLNSILATK